jgi:hypothetical protein
VVFIQQSTSMSSYPVHRSLPPTRRSSSDENLLPGEAQCKPLSPHGNLSLLRATRRPLRSLRRPVQGLGQGQAAQTILGALNSRVRGGGSGGRPFWVSKNEG